MPWIVAAAGVTTGALVAVGGGALHAGVLFAWAQPYERGELDLAGARASEREAALWLHVAVGRLRRWSDAHGGRRGRWMGAA